MSIYHYLLDEASGRCVSLGPEGRRDDHRFSGPAVRIDARDYRLPPHRLDTLLERFRSRHPDARVVDESGLEAALAAAEAVNPDEEFLLEVGGDGKRDIALADYLPEVETPAFRAELDADPSLLVR